VRLNELWLVRQNWRSVKFPRLLSSSLWHVQAVVLEEDEKFDGGRWVRLRLLACCNVFIDHLATACNVSIFEWLFCFPYESPDVTTCNFRAIKVIAWESSFMESACPILVELSDVKRSANYQLFPFNYLYH